MKAEGWRIRMKEWQGFRKRENGDVEMGEITRSHSEPLSMQVELIEPPLVHSRRETC